MKRKTIFRLRDFENKIVGYEKWYEGTLNKETLLYTARPQWLYSSDGESWNPEPIEHRFKDQDTGLKDKSGKRSRMSYLTKYKSKQTGEIRNVKDLELASGGEEKGFFVFFTMIDWKKEPDNCPDGYGHFRGKFYRTVEELKMDYDPLEQK